jgi:putative nucleotidyltransferase with HDIG domain
MLARSAPLQHFNRSDAGRFLLLALLLTLALGAVLALDALPAPFSGGSPVVNDVATVDIRAPRALTYESAAATQAARDQASAQVPPQYNYNSDRAQLIAQQQLNALQDVLAPADAAFAAVLTDAERQQALRLAIPTLTNGAKTTLSGLTADQWTALRAEIVGVLGTAERQEVRDTLLADVRAGIGDRVSTNFPADQRALAAEIIAPLLVANSTFDAQATAAAKLEAANAVAPVLFTFSKGEIIVQAGERLDAVSREKLDQFGLLNPQPDLARGAGWLALAALAVVLLLAWLWRFRPHIWHRNTALLLIALLVVAVAIALKVTGDRSVLPYVVPTAAAGLLLAVLLDAGAALMVTAMLALMAGAIVGSVEFAAYVLLGGAAGIIVVRRGERLSHFAQAAAAIVAVDVAVIGIFTLLGDRDITGLLELTGASLASGAGSALAAVGSFLLVGNLFGITTSFQLLELANPSQPLLRRLLLEAPGTYHHSLMVGNLAERAAEAIGADPLVARVAAYYHDIGKLANPLAYIENQTGENVHDELTPEQSVALLKAHVANGIDLAYQYKLPKPIIAFIPQHHGTALMSYFYHRAKEQAGSGGKVDEARFRHSGPKPQSREAAILMLADSVEASVRSLSAHDEPAIRAMVARIIRERLEDGQFDECDLTLRDLEHIREAFVAQLLGMYHRRIAYPQNKIVEIESRRAAV